MNRILFEHDEIGADGRVAFGGVRAEHVLSILHGTRGQVLKTGEVEGKIGTAVIEEIDERGPTVTVRVDHGQDSLQPWIDVILAPPRPRVLKRLLPQMAAMGVGRIVLVGAEKVEKAFWGAQLLKPEISRPLLVDGLMQAGTSVLPEIVPVRQFRRWMASADGFEAMFGSQPMRFVAHPYAQDGIDACQSAQPPAARPVLAIGPEGGWTPGEVSMLSDSGFMPVSLGRRILRTDTATIAVLSLLHHLCGVQD